MAFVKHMAGAAALGAALMIGSGLSAPAQAAFIETLDELGSNVVATGSGSLDLASLSFIETTTTAAHVLGSSALIFTGPTTTFDVYTGIAGPTNFGSNVLTFANSGTGD